MMITFGVVIFYILTGFIMGLITGWSNRASQILTVLGVLYLIVAYIFFPTAYSHGLIWWEIIIIFGLLGIGLFSGEWTIKKIRNK